MFSAILILFFLPLLGCFHSKSSKLLKIIQFFFWMFIFNFLLLGWLGSCIVEQPYILISQISSIFYFSFFLILPILTFFEFYFTKNKVNKNKVNKNNVNKVVEFESDYYNVSALWYDKQL